MGLFIGTHQNKLDAKGRVSVPAPFRSVLKKMSHAGEGALVAPLVLRPSHKYDCIEGWSEKGFEALSAPLENYNQFSTEHDDFVMALFGEACATETDKEGRIMIPPELVAHAGLTDAVVFIGTNTNFQIWEPAAGARRIAAAKAAVRAAQMTLKTTVTPGSGAAVSGALA
jgi:MraZ protein